jgi:hypothetical protein
LTILLFIPEIPAKAYSQAEADKLLKNCDFSYDWTINILDIATQAQHFNSTDAGSAPYDLNDDGIVDLFDMVAVSKRIGQTVSTTVSTMNLAETVEQWQPYTLPSSIIGDISSGESIELPVIWDQESPDLSTPGIKTVVGTLQGYNEPVNFLFNISPIVETGVNIGNIVNNGFAAQQGSYIYYANFANSGFLSRARNENTEIVKLAEDVPCFINAVNNWIYYCNSSDSYKIYKIRNDGTQRTLITQDNAKYINVVGDWIYYLNMSDRNLLYKIKTDGTGRKKISSIMPVSMNVVGDWIYYSNSVNTGFLCKIRTDGTQGSMISIDQPKFINVVGNWIYYVNISDSSSIYKIGIDGTGRTKLNNLSSAGLNVSENWIYYTCNIDSKVVLSRMNTDGTGNETLVTGYNPALVNIAANKMYFFDLYPVYHMFRANFDGSNVEPFGIDHVIGYIYDHLEYVVRGDSFVFPEDTLVRMSDGSHMMLPVTWQGSYDIDTSDLKSYVFHGTVEGYPGQAALYVTVAETGNSNSNSSNIGFAAEQDGWIYYKNSSDGMLYKERQDKTERVKLCDDTPYNINVIGDWIYFKTAQITTLYIKLEMTAPKGQN